jgi:hypothetical protein
MSQGVGMKRRKIDAETKMALDNFVNKDDILKGEAKGHKEF